MNIVKVAKKLNIKKSELLPFGDDKAKITKTKGNKNGKLVLVTAINPTPSGEGKTTVSIGLADALNLRRKKVCLALREPSLGPVFGMKGGATGGGMSSIIPSQEINLHFTGDFHAITSANNLLCAMIDNHIYQGNILEIERVCFNRCLDVNDRALRDIILVGDGKHSQDRREVFNITAASEIMAIMCVAKDIKDLEKRLGDIIIGYNKSQKPVYAKDLKAETAMTILLKDAFYPNLVQTLIGTPAIVHCGPFANIAHGCNSIVATNLALSLADYVITEAGFGADLGAEKFLDFKCRNNNLNPNAVVLVATIKALKHHGESEDEKLALEKGIDNLYRHIDNLKNVFSQNVIVAINKWNDDSEEDLNFVKESVQKNKGVKAILVDVWSQSGKGALALADEIIEVCKKDAPTLTFSYNLGDSIEKKCRDIATKVYGAKAIKLTEKAEKDIKEINSLKLSNLPIIIAKTQYSFSDNAKLLNAPKDFTLEIKEFQIRNGAGFIVAIAGNMLLMPGLNKTPRAVKMKLNFSDNKIEYSL